MYRKQVPKSGRQQYLGFVFNCLMKCLAFSLKAEIFYPICNSKYFFVLIVKRLSKKKKNS